MTFEKSKVPFRFIKSSRSDNGYLDEAEDSNQQQKLETETAKLQSIRNENQSDSDYEEPEKKIQKRIKKQMRGRMRRARTAIEEFTSNCIKDLKKKLSKKALEKRKRNAELRVLLGKGLKTTVKKITVKRID